MNNTLFDGDFVLTTKFETLKKNDILSLNRNDVILFDNLDDKEVNVKRCVGLPGDSVLINKGILFVNNKELSTPKEAIYYFKIWYKSKSKIRKMTFAQSLYPKDFYIADSIELVYLSGDIVEEYSSSTSNQQVVFSPAFIPDKKVENSYIAANNYYVIGDNRCNSLDSRRYGTIHKKDIIGKASMVLFNDKKFCWDRFLKKIK
jgi:signal peptidase I